MHRRTHNVRLGTRLIILLLAAIIVSSVGVAFFLIRSGQREARVEAFDLAQGITEAVSQNVNAFVGNADSVLGTVDAFPEFIHLSPTIQGQTLLNLLDEFPYFQRLAVRGPDGEVLAREKKGFAAWSPAPQIVANAFKVALEGKTYISAVHYGAAKEPVVLLMVPIAPPGEKSLGTIAGIVELGPLQQVLEGVAVGPESAVYLVDSYGRVIAHSELDAKVVGQSFLKYPVVKAAVSGKLDTGFTRTDIYVDPDGNTVVGAYRRLPRTGWGIVIQQPADTVFGPNYRMVGFSLIWTLLFALVFGLLGLYLIRRIEQEHDAAVKSEREAQTLYKVSQALALSLRLEDRLRVIEESLTEICGTSKAALWIIDRNSLVPSVSLGLSRQEDKAFQGAEIHLETASDAALEALSAGKPIAIEDAQAGRLTFGEFANKVNIKSLLVVPITLERERVGLAITYSPNEVRRFTPDQVRLAQALAAQAATAIENVRAYERERRIAETLQRAMLPTVPPSIDGFEIADKYAPASSEAEIGGDLYDVFQITDDKFVIVIADVSGKGLSAGVYTAMVKYMLRAYAVEDPKPVVLAGKLNDAIYKFAGQEMFVTLFYGLLDISKKEMQYVNAGHELPLLFGEDRKICMRLATTGTAMGIVPDYDYSMERVDFLPGDVMLFYTDGATDARKDGEFLGMEGLETMFCSVASGTAHEIVDAVDRGVREYAGGLLRDDVALLVLKYRRLAASVNQS